MKKIIGIIGARPQFIKHAPIEIAAKNIFKMVTVHTGQHYDHSMSQVFFDELNISKPDYSLGAGSGLHGKQTARMIMDLEPIMVAEKPDFVIVYGDTNSTLAGALVASKLQIPIIHIEAGLRSFNRTMPEELNRVITDHLSSILFVPTQTAVDNLKNEGITKNVYLIGDVMYDMIKICVQHNILKKNNRGSELYYFATIHRPYNTDDANRVRKILDTFEKLPLQVRFAVHPRTHKKIESLFRMDSFKNIRFSEPLSYFDTIRTMFNSELIITDSGGLQKEAYMLKKKCITIRSETEWIETLTNGWNTLVFEDIDKIMEFVDQPTGEYINDLYGDGNAAKDIINVLNNNHHGA